MNDTTRSVWLGFRQRLASSLAQDFYPEGMPEDWRNNYLVMMTSAVWIAGTDVDMSDALSAVADAPRPVLAVLQGDDDAFVRKEFSDWVAAHPDQPVMQIAPGEVFWRPDSTAHGCQIGLVPQQDQPQVLRSWIESFVAQAPGATCALFIDGDAPSVPTLERLQTLVELMGL